MSKGITKERIVAEALALLDEEGLGGVTVRALAARLGVKAPALYWHVRDKAALLDEMATRVWQGIEAELADSPDGLSWDAELRGFADVLRRALLAHRDGARAFSGTYLTDVGVLRRQEAGLRRWREHGFSLRDTVLAFAMANNLVVGFCIEEQSVAEDVERYRPDVRAQRIGPQEFPLTAAAGSELFGDADSRFTAQIEVLVDAIGRRRRGAGEALGR